MRGIRDLNLEGFQDINLLLGDNDAGKTTVLEAIMLCEAPDDIARVIRNSRIRIPVARTMGRDNYVPFETFLHLFPFDEDKKQIELEMTIDRKKHHFEIKGELLHTLKSYSKEEMRRATGLSYVASKRADKDNESEEHEVTVFGGTLSFDGHQEELEIDENYSYRLPFTNLQIKDRAIVYVAPGDHLNGRMSSAAYKTSRKQELEIVKLLRLIDPEIEGYKLQESEFTNGTNQVIEHKRFGNVPLYTYGDGMKKIMALASNVVNAKDGILMLDEIETSLQASNLSRVFGWLIEACKLFRVQLFATTHSLEAISALAEYASENESELACFRLERYKERMKAKRFSEKELNQLVNGSGMDVR